MCTADEQTWLPLNSSEAAAQAACTVLEHLAPLSHKLSSTIFAAAPLPTEAGRALKSVSPQTPASNAATVGSPAQHLLTCLARQSIYFAPLSRPTNMLAQFFCIPLLWERCVQVPCLLMALSSRYLLCTSHLHQVS